MCATYVCMYECLVPFPHKEKAQLHIKAFRCMLFRAFLHFQTLYCSLCEVKNPNYEFRVHLSRKCCMLIFSPTKYKTPFFCL